MSEESVGVMPVTPTVPPNVKDAQAALGNMLSETGLSISSAIHEAKKFDAEIKRGLSDIYKAVKALDVRLERLEARMK